MKYLTWLIFTLIFISTGLESREKTQKEITIALVNDFSWIQAQVDQRVNQPNPVPREVSGIKIFSSKEMISAYEVVKKKHLTISKTADGFEVAVPDFSVTSNIVINYNDYTVDQEGHKSHTLPSWIEKIRLNGYIAASAGIFHNKNKWGDAFTNAESKIKDMGFNNYTRHAKSSHYHHSTLWNTKAIKNKNGVNPFMDSPDLVRDMGRRAKVHGLNFIAYYKDTGDNHIAQLHPEWVCKTPDGEKSEDTFLFLDLVSPFKDIVLAQLIELLNRGADGVYLDFRHFPAWGCFGSETERLFETETGLEAPTSVSGKHWQWHPNWTRFLEFQSQKIAATFEYWLLELKKRKPSFQFIISSAYLSGLTTAFHGSELAEIADIVKVEFDHGLKKGLRRSVFSKNPDLFKPSDHLLMTMAFTLGRDLSAGKMFHAWAYGFPNEDHLKGFVSTVLATGGIAAIHVDDQYLRSDFDPKNYSPIYESATPYSAYEPAITLGKRISKSMEGKSPSQWAAVLFPEKSRNNFQNDIKAAWRNVLWPAVGAYGSFLELGVPVSLMSHSTFQKDYKKIKLLFIPLKESLLSSKTKLAIGRFKRNGGVVISNDKQWRWDNPKLNKITRNEFKKLMMTHINEVPFRVIPSNETGNAESVYSFFYE